MSVNVPTMGHPYTIVKGPPYVRPVLYVVVRPVKTEIMENVTEKFDIALYNTYITDTKNHTHSCRFIHVNAPIFPYF